MTRFEFKLFVRKRVQQILITTSAIHTLGFFRFHVFVRKSHYFVCILLNGISTSSVINEVTDKKTTVIISFSH